MEKRINSLVKRDVTIVARTIMRLGLLIPLFLICCALTIHSAQLELVKAIGDDRDDYLIMGISDALITGNNDIFILDGRGNFLSQYGWDGAFKKRFGQIGQGPGDFYFPMGLDYYNGNIYVCDKGNRRIVEINLSTQKTEIYRNSVSHSFDEKIVYLPDGHFLGIFSHATADRGRLGIVDKKGNLLTSFFKEYPFPMKPIALPTGENKSVEVLARSVLVDQYSRPIFEISEDKKEILVSFRHANNPVIFYVFNVNGDLLKKFTYLIDEKQYRFPEFFLTASIDKLRDRKKYPNLFKPEMEALALTKDKYIAFLNLVDYEKDLVVRNRRFCLIFNKQGKFEKKFELADIAMLRYSSGYFLGVYTEGEVSKVGIFRLKMD